MYIYKKVLRSMALTDFNGSISWRKHVSPNIRLGTGRPCRVTPPLYVYMSEKKNNCSTYLNEIVDTSPTLLTTQGGPRRQLEDFFLVENLLFPPSPPTPPSLPLPPSPCLFLFRTFFWTVKTDSTSYETTTVCTLQSLHSHYLWR